MYSRIENLYYVFYITLIDPPAVGYESDVTLTLTAFGISLVCKKLPPRFRPILSCKVDTISFANVRKLCDC